MKFDENLFSNHTNSSHLLIYDTSDINGQKKWLEENCYGDMTPSEEGKIIRYEKVVGGYCICTFGTLGLLGNLLSIMVLCRKDMRKNCFSQLLIGNYLCLTSICWILFNTYVSPHNTVFKILILSFFRFSYVWQSAYHIWNNGISQNILERPISWQPTLHLSLVSLSLLPHNTCFIDLHDDCSRYRKVLCCLFSSQLS